MNAAILLVATLLTADAAPEPTPQEVCAKEHKQACYEAVNVIYACVHCIQPLPYWCSETCPPPISSLGPDFKYQRIEPKDGGQ